MKATIVNLQAELDARLQTVRVNVPNVIKESEESIKVLQEIISQLKEYTLSNEFESEAEEIYFFKCVKPKFLSWIIYYKMVLKIEIRKPPGSKIILKKYLHNEIQKLTDYFDIHLDFFTYRQADSTHFDNKYFLRQQDDIRIDLECYHFDRDPLFSTSHDYRVAEMLAHEMVADYLEGELDGIVEKEGKGVVMQEATKAAIEWTESKASLVELIYALYYHGAVQRSEAGIKEIAGCFESAFGIDLGDFYRTFIDIKSRKTGKAKFLESLKATLLKKIEEGDGRF